MAWVVICECEAADLQQRACQVMKWMSETARKYPPFCLVSWAALSDTCLSDRYSMGLTQKMWLLVEQKNEWSEGPASFLKFRKKHRHPEFSNQLDVKSCTAKKIPH